MKDQFQIHSKSGGTLVQAWMLFLSYCKQSSGDSGCTLHTIVLFQRSLKNKHLMPLNPFELVVASLFWSSTMLGVIKSLEQPLKL